MVIKPRLRSLFILLEIQLISPRVNLHGMDMQFYPEEED
jgi:hypothetical protein